MLFGFVERGYALGVLDVLCCELGGVYAVRVLDVLCCETRVAKLFGFWIVFVVNLGMFRLIL